MRVIVVVEGGVVQQVFAPDGSTVEIWDFDEYEENGNATEAERALDNTLALLGNGEGSIIRQPF